MVLELIKKYERPDFSFIFYELKSRRPLDMHGGYPCLGYPQPDKFVPAFKKVDANFQMFEFCDYSNAGVDFGNPIYVPEEPFKAIGQKIQSDKVLIEWDPIISHRDYRNIFGWNKEIYVIPHNAQMVGGASLSQRKRLAFPDEKKLREEITENSINVIFQCEYEKAMWGKSDKFEIIYPPTRTGIQFDKMESRKTLGITTKYVLICWGAYSGKNNEDIIPWIAEWKDTSLLFVGSGDEEYFRRIAEKYNISKNIFFSPHGISDVDADLWFSASDLCTYPRNIEGSTTPAHVIGQGKCMIVLPLPLHKAFEEISGVVTSTDLKEITRELLLNEEKRKKFELKSLDYARRNSFEDYAIKIGKLMGYEYKKV